MPEIREADPSKDFDFVERDEPEKIVATLIKFGTGANSRTVPIRSAMFKVLCPMNRGSLGVRELNTALQKVLNPVQADEPSVERFGWRFQMPD
jgi:exodeoxyribonuclease V alpha subunit